jgi:putative ABC transport system ATP-binding protein
MTTPEVDGPTVEVQGVNRDFHTAGVTVHAVRDVSLQISRGEFLAIVGRSGSGKTTLLNLIAGLDKPDTGAVLVAGEDITQYNDAQMTKFRRHTIGFVFQSFGLLPLLSAAENVELALRIAGVGLRERSRRTDELLEQVALSHRAGHRPYELSGGEQQRVAVARALANEPPLLIADEPTGELDSATGAQIFQLLHDVAASGVTVITATHDPFVIEHVDRVIEMDDGALLTQPPEDSTSPADPSAVAAVPNRALPPRRPAPGR